MIFKLLRKSKVDLPKNKPEAGISISWELENS